MAKGPYKTGYYFAQQFAFRNLANISYTGLELRENSHGDKIIHAVFSSFQAGAKVMYRNCHGVANDGPGVNCAVDIEGTINVGGTTWKGTLVNTRTGRSTVVGMWTLPAGARKLVNGQLGFVEYFNWNDGKPHACDRLPFTEATFYYPTSKTRGAHGDKIPRVYEYGNCVGKCRYSVKELSNGYDIKVGF
ncbi:hypothetical protein BGZ72_009237 [Mortierella alpina]|nr:hypothetical protein BGZ72_009237 [Mortierella alpina]